MTHLAMAYTDLLDIDATAPLNEEDRECMKEIRDVLARHNKLNRFGLTLLHSHFAINKGEILLESCDTEARELIMRVVPETSIKASEAIETSWRLSDSEAMTRCESICTRTSSGHSRQHHHHV